jgi:hypothetical protein
MASPTVIAVGDLMRISVELIREIAEQPGATTEVVTVADIRLEPDGTKTLTLRRVEHA